MARTMQPAIRDILNIIDLAGERRSSVVAADLARQTGAHLTGVSLAFDPLVPVYSVGAPIPTDFITTAHEQAIADANAASEAFTAIGERAGIGTEIRTVESVAGDGFVSIVRSLVLADLCVIGQDSPDVPEPMRRPLTEAILFQGGMPTLIVPYYGVTQFVPDKAVVAWNGSAAAARAIRAALPLLTLAKHVVVAMVDEGREQQGEPGADIGAYLARHDLDVTVRTIQNAPNGAGAALLAFAAEEEANWLVMGAYGHSRLLQFLLGGVTRHVLANATLPVLMAH